MKGRFVHTIQERFVILFTAFLIPAVIVILLVNMYLTSEFRHQQLESYVSAASYQSANLAAELNSAYESIARMESLDNKTLEMQYLPQGSDRIYAEVSVFNRLNQIVSQYSILSSAFLYAEYSEKLLTWENDSMPYDDRIALRENIMKYLIDHKDTLGSGWKTFESGGSLYVMNIYYGDSITAGCFISCDDILSLSFAEQEKTAASLLYNGTVIASSERMAEIPYVPHSETDSSLCRVGRTLYYHISCAIGTTSFSLCYLVKAERFPIVSNYVIILLLTAFGVILFIVIFILSSFTFTKPVMRIRAAMDNVGTKMDPDAISDLAEFRTIAEGYNDAMEKIRTLTDEAIRNERERQEARFKALQMQIKPHFIMNSLNMIYAASKSGKMDVVEEMSLHLSSYFNHSLKTNSNLIPLSDEIKFADDYLRIQKLRYPDSLNYMFSVPPFLRAMLVPNMCIKTIVENSVKYSMIAEKPEIRVAVSMKSDGSKAFMKITVEDNGSGYPPLMITDNWIRMKPCYDTEKHTGIRNLAERLDMIFSSDASLALGVSPLGGALTTITLPLLTKDSENVSGIVD